MTPLAFRVTADELKTLSSMQAVDALRDLVYAESKLLGIPITGVNVPIAITVRDGGVDAEVTCPIEPTGHNGVLRAGYTCYQVKTGDFSASRKTDIKTILLRPSSKRKAKPTENDLNDRVKECVDRKGTLVLVLFGSDAVDRTPDATVKAFREFLAEIDPRYQSAVIEIWRVNQMVNLISNVTGLSLRLKGLGDIVPFAHDRSWMKDCCSFEGESFLLSEGHRTAFDLIRSTIREKAAFRHIRLVGEAGCGKTRLVYEALGESDIAPLVVYCEDGDQLIETGIVELLRQLAAHMPMVLVVDECDGGARSTIQQRMRGTARDLTLITIHNEEGTQDKTEVGLRLIEAPKLLEQQIAQILMQYEVPADQAKTIAGMCDGSPRVAQIVGASLRRESGTATLVTPTTLQLIWDNYIAGKEGRDSPQFRVRALIITCVALFKKFGWQGSYKQEGVLIYEKLIRPLDPTLSYDAFQAEIEYFRSVRILQGKSTLYITPRLLHVKLWCDWWDKYSHRMDVATLIEALSDQLRAWMQEMFVYARESWAASEVVNRILDPSGPYASIKGFSTESGASFFFALAQVNPGAAVRRLSDALGTLNIEERSHFGDGRRPVVHALEHIAVFEEYFLDAAECLLLLAEAENETWANNATGVFTELFTLGYGKLAATELAPSERLPYLVGLLESESESRRALALQAFQEALSTQMTRTDIGDAHGLRRLPDRWMPATYGDWWNAYLQYFEALYSRIPRLPAREAREAIRIILQQARSLVQMKPLAQRYPSVFRELAQRDQESATGVLETIVSILRYERNHPDKEFMAQLEAIYQSLVNVSFSTRLRRYAALDLIEDKFNEEGEQEDQAEIAFRGLAAEVFANPALLTPELAWLNSSDAKNGYLFGRELGRRDRDLSLWRAVRESWAASAPRHDFFVGGFLAGLFENDKANWERELRLVATNDDTVSDFPVLLWRSGMSESMAELYLDRARADRVDLRTIRMFVYGAVVRAMPGRIIEDFVDLLLARGDRKDVEAGIDVLAAVLRGETSPSARTLDLCVRALGHESLFTASKTQRVDTMVDFHWNELAKIVAKFDQPNVLSLARTIIERFGRSGTIFGEYRPQSLEFLDNVLDAHPREMWEIVSSCLIPPLDERALDLLRWMRGGDRVGGRRVDAAFEKFPQDAILAWVSADPKKRAIVIAHFVPPTIADENFEGTLAHEILASYGNLKDVRSAFHANFNTGAWTGPASQHHRQKRGELEAAKSRATNANIRRWIHEQIVGLDEMIQQEEAWEEREGLGG
jgi:hypothetical protein